MADNRMLDPYGLRYRPMMSDAEDMTTANVSNAMLRNQQYEQSPFGRINAMLTRQTDALEGTSAFNPVNMMLEGAKTANRWVGSAAGYGDRLQAQDMLAPLGVGAVTAPFMPTHAVGSIGGRLRGMFGRQADEAPTPAAVERPEQTLPENFRAEPMTDENPLEFFPMALEQSLFVLDSPAYEATLRSIAQSGASKDEVKGIFEAFMGYQPASNWGKDKMLQTMEQRQLSLKTSRARSRATAGRIAG